MKLIRKVKSKLDKENIELEEEPKAMLLPESIEDSFSAYPKELMLKPRVKEEEPIPVKTPETGVSVEQQLMIINSKIDLIKMQLDSLNQTINKINLKLK